MQMQDNTKRPISSTHPAPARWRAERTALTATDPLPSLVPTHARGLVDVLLAMADEYPAPRATAHVVLEGLRWPDRRAASSRFVCVQARTSDAVRPLRTS